MGGFWRRVRSGGFGPLSTLHPDVRRSVLRGRVGAFALAAAWFYLGVRIAMRDVHLPPLPGGPIERIIIGVLTAIILVPVLLPGFLIAAYGPLLALPGLALQLNVAGAVARGEPIRRRAARMAGAGAFVGVGVGAIALITMEFIAAAACVMPIVAWRSLARHVIVLPTPARTPQQTARHER